MGYADIGTAAVQAQFYEEPLCAVPGSHMSGYGSQPAIVGGVLGKHSISDVRELMSLVDFQVEAMDKLVASRQPIPSSSAVPLANWLRWRDAWHAASDRVAANLKARSRIIPEGIQVAEVDYTTLKCAINKSCDESHTDPGDMREVMAALEQSLGQKADLSGFRTRFPSEPTGTDPDLAAFQATDTILRTVTPAPLSPKSFLARIPWWAYGLGLVTAGAIGYSFYRTAKKAHAQAQWGAQYLGQRVLPGSEGMPIYHNDSSGVPSVTVPLPVAPPKVG